MTSLLLRHLEICFDCRFLFGITQCSSPTLHLPCSGVARCPREARLKSWRAALGGARSGCWLRAGLQGFWTCSAGGTENAHVRACPCPLRATSLSLLLTKVSIYDLMLVSHIQHRGSAVPHIAKSSHPQCGHYINTGRCHRIINRILGAVLLSPEPHLFLHPFIHIYEKPGLTVPTSTSGFTPPSPLCRCFLSGPEISDARPSR